jgi:outer membrane usher protein FimD/PapC
MFCAVFAHAGDVQVEATMVTSPEGKETTTFPVDAAKVFASFKTKGASNGDKIRGVWIADDVGDAAPKGTKIDEKTLKAEGDTEDGVFSLSKPDNGWPVGKYHLEIYVNDELATKLNFTIKAKAKPKKHSDEEEEEEDSGD